MKFIAALILTTAPALAMAGETTAFGFELGKPLTLPECHYKVLGTGEKAFKNYELVPETTCVEDPRALVGYGGTPVRRVLFSKADMPAILTNWSFVALEAHGDLIGIQFYTLGVSTQDATLAQLTEKYGKPTTVAHETVKNAVGGTFDKLIATWDLSTVKVTFDSAPEQLDMGTVKVDMPEAVAMRRAWLAAATDGKNL